MEKIPAKTETSATSVKGLYTDCLFLLFPSIVFYRIWLAQTNCLNCPTVKLDSLRIFETYVSETKIILNWTVLFLKIKIE